MHRSTLLKLLREIRDSRDIGRAKFPSRYVYGDSTDDYGNVDCSENTELRHRDSHLLYAERMGLVSLEAQKIDGFDDFFGGWVSITPKGLSYLEAAEKNWFRRQLETLQNGVLTILVAVLVSWAIYYFGAPAK